MAGSYRHVTDADGSFRGIDLIDNLGDAYEALEEMHDMIAWFAETCDPENPKRAIWLAAREGHMRLRIPRENYLNERISGYDAFWERDDE